LGSLFPGGESRFLSMASLLSIEGALQRRVT
jgi:hypothetical protein